MNFQTHKRTHVRTHIGLAGKLECWQPYCIPKIHNETLQTAINIQNTIQQKYSFCIYEK